MILLLCYYLFKKLLDAKKLNYKTQDNNQFIYKSRAVEQLKNFASSQWSAKLVLPPLKNVYICSSCRIQSEEPFKDLKLPNK